MIADFMGTPYKDGAQGSLYQTFPKQPQFTKEIKYADSWDWLMPVIAKCNEAGDFSETVCSAMLLKADIKYMYSKVVEFIERLNRL